MKELIVTIKDKEPVNKKQVREFFSVPDGKYLYIRERADKRSLDQNAYYWKIVVPMVKEGLRNMGFDDVRTKEDAHSIMKHLFLRKEFENKQTGDKIPVEVSTTGLTKLQFCTYFEEIWKWASDYLGIYIPAPNEQTKMFNDQAA